ncbi:MAG: Uma2 family endonuclease [Myxococcales bacterium]|nr:Uma2 family endonuclease [Myxococcales bacterium]
MGTPAQAKATYTDLLAVPDDLVAELIEGSLYTHPRPSPQHANSTSVLGADLNGPFQRGKGGPGGWWILFEPELHLGDDVMVPDLAGWRRERLPALPDTAWFSVAPDWVCETLSPSNAFHDRARKLPRYAAAGIAWAWLVHPTERYVEVFENVGGSWVQRRVAGEDEEAALPPFDAVTLKLTDLWDTGA